MNELLEGLRKRVSNLSITALYPSMRCLLDSAWNDETGFADEECADFFEEILYISKRFVELGDETGIPHYVLYLGTLLKGGIAEQQGDEKLVNECIELIDFYIHKAIDLGLNLAYCDFGKTLFLGNGIWEKDERTGLELMKKATELPILPELGMDNDYVKNMLKDCYDECLIEYSKTNKPEAVSSATASNVSTSEEKRPKVNREKTFTSGYYLAGWAAFIGYILVSVLLRAEFGLQSAYDVSSTGNWLLAIVIPLVLNYSVIPLLTMAYFYKRNNGKHSVFFVILYIVFLVTCYADSILPYISSGNLLEGNNLLNALLYPTIFLVTHRLLSLLIYAIIRTKEGESDYRIYYGLALFAPFMAPILLIGIVFWIYQAFTEGNSGSYQGSSAPSSFNMKEYVHGELSVGIRTSGVYYDDGWKVVDYWNNSSSLSEVQGGEWGNTYFKDSSGKIYVLSTNCPDKETVYYFN